MTIGQSIKKHIQEQGRSVREVAIKAGISPQTIYQWIWGMYDPTVTMLIWVADVLGVTLDELVGRKVEK